MEVQTAQSVILENKKNTHYFLLFLLCVLFLGAGFLFGKDFGITSKDNQLFTLNTEFEAYKKQHEPSLMTCNNSLLACTQELDHAKDLSNTLMGRLQYSAEPELTQIDSYADTFLITSYKISAEVLGDLNYDVTQYEYLNHTIFKRENKPDAFTDVIVWEFEHFDQNLSESQMLADFIINNSTTNTIEYVSDILINSEERYINVNGLEFYFYDQTKEKVKMYTYQRDLVNGMALLIELSKQVEDQPVKTISELKQIADTFVQL